MINQAWGKPIPLIALQPRGNQAASENDSYIGELLLEHADHGKGREGLAQIIEGEANNRCPIASDNCPQALAEIFKKRIFRWVPGSVQKIFAFNRREASVTIIGKADTHTIACCHGEQAVYIQYRALIGIDILIGFPASEAVEVP
jgi:hypothetical protein